MLEHVLEGAVGAGGEGGGVDGREACADPDEVFVAGDACGVLDDLLEGGEGEVEADAYAFADGFGLLELPGLLGDMGVEGGEEFVAVEGEGDELLEAGVVDDEQGRWAGRGWRAGRGGRARASACRRRCR